MAGFDDLKDAINTVNDVPFGLTGGLYSEDESEIQTFLDNVEVGVAMRQPLHWLYHRCLAPLPTLWRLEGQHHHRHWHRQCNLSATLHANRARRLLRNCPGDRAVV